jgi:dual specificity phosphatase 12
MGKSRSVTIAVAYLLRQFPHHTVGSALKQIRESRPIAEPNDGFMAQLELYKKMGCPRNIENHPLYQKWLFQIEVELAVAAGLGPSTVRFEDEQIQEERRSVRREIELRCKKCRYVFCSA